MQALMMFSSFLVAQALDPNIYFEVFNKSTSENFTRIFYHLNFYENSATMSEIKNKLDIFMIHYVSQFDRVTYKRSMLFASKENKSEFAEIFLTKTLEQQNVKNSFYANDILQQFFKCNLKAQKMYGKFYITKAIEKDKNFTSYDLIFPSWYEAYFCIYEQKDHEHESLYHDLRFCEPENNFKFMIVCINFSVLFVLIILFEFNCVAKKVRKRRTVVEVIQMN